MSGAVLETDQRIVLRPPHASEASELRELCVRSKASWGYDAEFLDQCRPWLGIDMELVREGLAVVAEVGGRPAGVAQIVVRQPNAELDLLFVDPDNFHRAIGRALLNWASQTARSRGASTLRILSDPGAREFYLRHGARFVGEVPSDAIRGRRLPLMVLDLAEAG